MQVWCIAVFWNYCFFTITLTASHIKSHFTKSMIKSSRMSFGDLISACKGSLHNLSIWRDLTFKFFHHVKTFFMKRTVSFLSTLIPDWLWSALYVFSENTLRQLETSYLSIGFGAMQILFRYESLTSFQIQNDKTVFKICPFSNSSYSIIEY